MPIHQSYTYIYTVIALLWHMPLGSVGLLGTDTYEVTSGALAIQVNKIHLVQNINQLSLQVPVDPSCLTWTWCNMGE